MEEKLLTEEQKSRIHQLEFYYKEATKYVRPATDNGCGMDENTMRHIFDKFYQADTSHKTKGNGLGLAMVRQIVNLLNGNIEVTSKLGEGSTFKVSLPKCKS